jgi:hypothetical protein
MTGGLKKTTSRLAIATIAGFAASSAMAADLGGNCCADLEERVAELEATTARKGNRKVSLTVSGQVNEAIIFWDDGGEKNAYVVSNNNSRTRFRFVGDAKINSDWSAGYLLEIGVRYANSGNRNQNTTNAGGDQNRFDIRHSAWWLESKQLGRVWVGQTSSASDGITEINLANVVNAGSDPSAWQGGFNLRGNNGVLSNQTWNSITPSFNGAWNAGEGDRNNIVRYVSPTWQGFTFSTAWGEDDMWDVSLRYAGEFNGVRLAGGVAYKELRDNVNKTGGQGGNGGASQDGPQCADLSTSVAQSAVECHTFGLSGSVMHVATGLFVTGSYGFIQDDNRKELFRRSTGATNVQDKDEHWYIQAGLERNHFGIGLTTFYGEYGNYTVGAGLDSTNGANAGRTNLVTLNGITGLLSDAEVRVWGVGVNQQISAANMDIYVSYRHFEADINASLNGGQAGKVAVGVKDFDAVMMGAIIRF